MTKDGGGRSVAIVALSVALVASLAALVPLTIVHLSRDTALPQGCQCPLLPSSTQKAEPQDGSTPEAVDASSPLPTEPSKPLKEEQKSRRKRGAGVQQCPTGMTGPFCQYPVCPQRIPITSPTNGMTGFGRPIDINVYTNCLNQKGSFSVDSTHLSLFVLLDSEYDGNPSVNLTMPNGQNAAYKIVNQNSAQIAISVAAPMPGLWGISLSSAKSCVEFVMGTTTMTINDGILSGPGALQSDVPSGSIVEGTPSYFVAHGNGLQCPGSIQELEIYESNQLVWTSAASSRFNCSYDTYFGLIDCDNAHAYYYKMFGMDGQGFRFQRTNTIFCAKAGTPTPPPPPTTPKPGTCDNGGTFLSPGVCVCPPFFSGQYCGQFLCLNGATLQAGNQCICPTGFSGPHCQVVKCDKGPPNNFDTVHRTLAIVFNTRSSMQADYLQLFQAAAQVIDGFNRQHPGAIINYVLTTFVDNYLNTTSYTSAKSYTRALATLVTQLQPATNCDQPVLGAVADALKQTLPYSPIYVVTDALASDYAMVETLQHVDAFSSSELYFILTNRTGNHGDSTLTCPTNNDLAPGYSVYRTLAEYTTGQLVSIPKPKLGSLVQAFFPTQYGTDVLFTGDYFACSQQPSYTTFLVDTSVKTVYVYGSGPGIANSAAQSLVLTGPAGSVVSPSNAVAIGNLYLWTFTAPAVGIYQVKYSTAQPMLPCSLRVRGVTKLRMFYGVSGNIAVDKSSPMPTYKTPGHMVVHVNGLNIPQGQLFGGEVAIRSPGGNTKFLSSGQIRQQCDYQVYFAPYNCTHYGQIFYLTYFGRDNNGVGFERSRAGFCSPSRVTPAPPGGCQNGGVRPKPEAQCFCPAWWNGTSCQTALCANGGTSLGQQCDCAPGFSGSHCTINNCLDKNPRVLSSPNNRSLVFVVQNTPSMQPEITQLINNIDSFIAQANQDNPSWFELYGLVTFGDTQYDVAYSGTSQSQFVAAVKALTTTGHSATCDRNVLSAATAGLLLSVPYGTVYVFTDGGAADYAQTSNLFSYLESTKATLTFVVTDPNPCNSNFTTSQTNIYESLAEYSDGQFFPISKTSVGQILQNYLGTLYSSGMVHSTDYAMCTAAQPTRIFFPIESAATGFTIAATGYQAQITLYDPTGKAYKYGNPIVQGDFVHILHAYHKTGTQADPFVPGVWSAVVTGVVRPSGGYGGCQLWVRAQSPLQVFYGFLQNTPTLAYPVHSDFPTREPEVARGLLNYMVAHVDGLQASQGHTSGHLGYMNNFADANGDIVSSGRFSLRQGCGYEYISQPFVCGSLYYTTVLSGYDAQGYAFNRLRVAICIPGIPVVTTTAPPPACQNGGVYDAPSKRCVCPSWWGGNLCQTAICANGGTPNGQFCACSPNFAGFHCTVDQCSTRLSTEPKEVSLKEALAGPAAPKAELDVSQTPEAGPNGRSFAWVIQNTASMYLDVKQLKASVEHTVGTMQQQNASWITHWILVTFDETNVTKTLVNSPNPADFIAGVQGLNPLGDLGTKCGKQVLHGLYAALQLTSRYGYVYTFTDSSSADFGFELMILPALEHTKAALSFVVTSIEPCQKPLSESSYQLLSAISDGQLFVIQKNQVQSALMYLEYLYRSSLADQHLLQNCAAGAAGTTLYFPLDYSANSFTLIVTGHTPSAKIYNPMGQLYTHAVPIVTGSAYTLVTHVYKRPGNLDHGVVPGLWKLVVSSTKDSSYGAACMVQVRVQSDIQMFYGFTQDMHSDLAEPEPSLDAPKNYMVAHVTGLQAANGANPGALEYATMYNDTFVQERSFRFLPRQGCGYEWVSQPFTCPRLALGIVTSGHDGYGYLFQRVRVALCFPSGPPPPATTATPIAPPTSTPSGPLNCGNGGVFSSGKCYCAPLFTGPTCASAICLNGGTAVGTGAQCNCVAGWAGPHCQQARCPKPNPFAPATFSHDQRTFALVVQNDLASTYDRQLIRENLNNLLTKASKDSPNWIKTWILVTFDATSAKRVVTASDPVAFYQQAYATLNGTGTSLGGCPKAIGAGIEQALSATSAYGYIWVFTNGVVNDLGLLAGTVFNQLESSRAQVSFVVSEIRPCGQQWTQNGTETFLQVAALSDGQVIPTTSQDIPAILSYIPSLYDSGLAFESGQVDCVSGPQIFYFPVDSHASSFVLSVSAFNATVRLLDPTQTPYTPVGLLTDFFVKIYTAKPGAKPKPGMWTVVVQATKQLIGCRVQVRVNSDIQVYYGFEQNRTTDFPRKEPNSFGNGNFMAGHATGLSKPGASLGYLQMFHPNGTMSAAASLSRRSNCAYDWLSQAFVCPNFYFLLYVNGVDELGFPFYRIRTAICIPQFGSQQRLTWPGLDYQP